MSRRYNCEKAEARRSNSDLTSKRLRRRNCFAVAAQFLLAISVWSNVHGQSSGVKKLVLNHVAAEPIRRDFALLTAKIRTNTDTATAYRHLDTLLGSGYGDMFWMYGCAG